MIAEKTSNPVVTRHEQAGSTFFRKATEEGFFGHRQGPAFLSPAVQPKLTISQPDDPQEKEADEVAEHVMRMPEAAAPLPTLDEQEDTISAKLEAPGAKPADRVVQVQRQPRIQRQPMAGTTTNGVFRLPALGKTPANLAMPGHSPPAIIQCKAHDPPQSISSFQSALSRTKGTGTPMPAETRSFMEHRFGADFSGVRIHTNHDAESMSADIHAQAFTHGNDIYFNAGWYAPHTQAGGTLLAHELTHTLQQGASKSNAIQRKPGLSRHSSGFPYHALARANAAHPKIPVSHNNHSGSAIVQPPKQTAAAYKRSSPTGSEERRGISKPIQSPEQPVAVSGKADVPKEAGASVAHSPKTPKQDPDFQQVKKAIAHEALRQRKHHAPASTKKTEAEDAAALPVADQISQDAKEQNTTAIEQVAAEQERPEKKFSADAFKQSLKALINAKKPKTEDAAKEMAKKPPVGDIAQNFSDGVAKEQQGVTGPLEQRAVPNPEGGSAQKAIVDLPKPAPPPLPKPVPSAQMIPKARTDEEVSAQQESGRIDDTMAKNKLSDDQLTESREPSFIETYKVKEAAKQKAAEVPAEYRKQEGDILEAAGAKAGSTTAVQLHSLMTRNKKSGSDVFTTQGATETKTEKRQREIKETIDGIYNLTVLEVKIILQAMTDKVKNDFTRILKEKTDLFNANLRSRISDYYGDWRIDDELFGPDPVVVNEDGSTRSLTRQEVYDMLYGGKQTEVINPDVYEIFVSEKDAFTQAMDTELDGIAENVSQGLMNAHKAIAAGQQMITTFKATLKGNELEYANQLEEEVKMKFQNLETSIDDARDDLLHTLADEYRDNLQAMEKSFKDINDELKKSWIDRAIEFIETVAKTIYQLVDLVISILARLASIIWRIIRHPIRFFETLVKGLMEGIEDFIENIGTYLQDSFWTWITGAVPGGAVKLTLGSGVEGMFKLVLNVLQLGPEDLRKVAEKVFGKEFMGMVDKVVDTIQKGIDIGAKIIEPVIILFTQGPAALWQYIKEHVQEFIQSAFDRMKETVFFAFVEKGIKYLASFFIPGGGFVKIVKAILSAFRFVADNMENIRQFFDSIFNSMEEALAGNTTGVRNKIVMGLKMGVVMALDFLAKLLGLNKIVDAVHKIIQTIRTAILNAIEFILVKLKPYVLAVVKKVKDLYQKGKDAVVGAGKKVLSWLGLKKSFTTDNGENHKLYFEGGEQNRRLTLASKNPDSIEHKVAARIKFLQAAPAENGSKIQACQEALSLKHGMDNYIAAHIQSKQEGEQETAAIQSGINDYLEKIRAKLITGGVDDTAGLPLSNVTFQMADGKAKKVTAQPLTKLSGNTQGRDVSGRSGPLGWTVANYLNSNRTLGKTSQGKASRVIDWRRVHLLSAVLHGPAENWNLTPTNQSANSRLSTIENAISDELQQGIVYDRYEVEITSYNASQQISDPVVGDWNTDYFPKAITLRKQKAGSKLEEIPVVSALPFPDPVSLETRIDYFENKRQLIDHYFRLTPSGRRLDFGAFARNQLNLSRDLPESVRPEVTSRLRAYYSEHLNDQ